MAVYAVIDWRNPVSLEYEEINGVLCNCYECSHSEFAENYGNPYVTPPVPDGWYLPFTKNEYKEHRRERYEAYIAWKALQADTQVRTKLRTRETDGADDQVELTSKPPTYFDISPRTGVHARWSIVNRSRNYAFRDE